MSANDQTKVANWVIESAPVAKEAEKLHKPAYAQLYFPYNSSQMNVTSLGRPTTELANGIVMPGKQDMNTCALNAAKIHNDKNAIAFGGELLSTPGATYYVYSGTDKSQHEDFESAFGAYSAKSDAVMEKVALYNPKNGGKNVQVKFANQVEDGGIWLYDSDPNKPKQAYLHTERKTYNDKKSILVFMNVPIKVVTRVKKVNQKEDLDVVFVGVATEMYKIPGNLPASNPVYFNYKNTGECAVYTQPLPENIEYKSSIIKTLLSIPLKPDTKTVKLDERGELKQYSETGQSASILYNDVSMAYSLTGPFVQKPGQFFVLTMEDTGIISIMYQGVPKTIARLEKTISPGKPAEWQDKDHFPGFMTSDKKSDGLSVGKSLLSKNGSYKMAIETDSSAVKLVVYGATANNNALYSVSPDPKMGKLFLADSNNMNMFTAHVPDKFTKRDNKTTVYDNMYPGNMADYDNAKGNCKQLCDNAAKGCDHYYETSAGCYVPKTGITPYVFSKKPDSVGSSKLHVVNRKASTGDFNKDAKVIDTYELSNDPYSKIGDNAYNLKMDSAPYDGNPDFKPYMPFHNDLTTEMQKKVFGEISEPNVKNPMSVFYKKKEGFSEDLRTQTLNRINNDILPRANAYAANQQKVNENKAKIAEKRAEIDTRYNNMADEENTTYDLPNNEFYDFAGTEIYSLREDRSLVKALLNDQQAMLQEQENLQIISGLTVLTFALVIVFGLKSME